MPSFISCRQSIVIRLGDRFRPLTVANVVVSLIMLGLAGDVQRKFRLLAVKDGDQFRVLAKEE